MFCCHCRGKAAELKKKFFFFCLLWKNSMEYLNNWSHGHFYFSNSDDNFTCQICVLPCIFKTHLRSCFICTLLTTVTGALIMPRWLQSCGWLVSFSSQGMLYNYQHPSWLPVSWCFFITSSIITASLWTSALQAMPRGSQRLSLDVPSPQWPWCPRLRFISNLFTRGSVQKVSQECN